MKIKVNQLIFFAILFQILSTQGVLTYLFFDLFGFWELKSVLHPLSLLFLILSFIFKYQSLKIRYEDVLFGIYFFFLIILLFINVSSFFSFYISFREVFVIFILSFLFNQFKFSHSQYTFLVNFLYTLVILNLFLVFLTYILGPISFIELLIGRSFWGVDEVTRFKISSYKAGIWRSPGAVGSSGALAYFALFSYFIIDQRDNQNFKKILAFVLLFSTFTRSAFLCLAIYEAFKFLRFKKNVKKIIKYGKIILPLFILGIFLLNQFQVFSLESLFMRFEIWFNEINVDFNWLFGFAIGEVGGAVRGQGVEAVLDNYWLFLLYSTGLIGILIWLIFFYEKAKKSQKKFYFTLGIVFSGGFVLLTQAIPFLVMFPLLFANYKALNDNVS